MSRIGFLAAALLLAFAVAASATQQGQAVINSWKQMDACARQAQAAFPDYTAAAKAKRNAALQRCLEAHSLPPRQFDPSRSR